MPTDADCPNAELMPTVLTATGGRIAEFVNPKYVDAEKVCCSMSMLRRCGVVWCVAAWVPYWAWSLVPATALRRDRFAAQCTRAHWQPNTQMTYSWQTDSQITRSCIPCLAGRVQEPDATGVHDAGPARHAAVERTGHLSMCMVQPGQTAASWKQHKSCACCMFYSSACAFASNLQTASNRHTHKCRRPN